MSSVHVKICDSDPEFTVTAGPWPMCMYAAQTRDPDDMEKGLFPSALLIKVCSVAIHRKLSLK